MWACHMDMGDKGVPVCGSGVQSYLHINTYILILLMAAQRDETMSADCRIAVVCADCCSFHQNVI